jgi:type III pantothenate kinase
MPNWLAITIGNSRLRWAWFRDRDLVISGYREHLAAIDNLPLLKQILPKELRVLAENCDLLPIYIASVVPQQTALWQNYPSLREITLADIPLHNLYPTLGIDRALAVWGAGEIYGYPCLVIDGGTALTFTGVDFDRSLIGGAILPGLGLQLSYLTQKTAALPRIKLDVALPKRWALNTSEAIASGIIYTILSGMKDFILDWRDRFPQSSIVFTGGDAELLQQDLSLYLPQLASQIKVDRQLIFSGMALLQ